MIEELVQINFIFIIKYCVFKNKQYAYFKNSPQQSPHLTIFIQSNNSVFDLRKILFSISFSLIRLII